MPVLQIPSSAYPFTQSPWSASDAACSFSGQWFCNQSATDSPAERMLLGSRMKELTTSCGKWWSNSPCTMRDRCGPLRRPTVGRCWMISESPHWGDSWGEGQARRNNTLRWKCWIIESSIVSWLNTTTGSFLFKQLQFYMIQLCERIQTTGASFQVRKSDVADQLPTLVTFE